MSMGRQCCSSLKPYGLVRQAKPAVDEMIAETTVSPANFTKANIVD
jgi:hypothetical protein